MVEVGRHLNIELVTLSQIQSITGSAGDFQLTLDQTPRYIDVSKCTGCGECAEACPVTLPSLFEQGLGARKATWRPYAQAVPGAFSITKKDRSPCTNACPNAVNAHGYVALTREKKYKEALEVITRNLPLPGSIGRICPHPCEEACRRQEVESPLSICSLKRFISDQVDLNTLDIPEVTPRPEKVAIVGAGPAGLTAAWFLANEGVQVTLLEALPVAGGMLKVGIPDYRLPPEILENEVKFITRHPGVEIRYNTALGRDFTVDSLMEEGYRAVYLAIGCHKGMTLGIPGEDLEGVVSGVKLLKEVALGTFDRLHGHVAIIGGGDVAIDAARTALRIGAEKVSILYRRTEAEMPARDEEIEDALEEGVDIQFLTAPREVKEENGRTVALTCFKMELGEPDDSGRRRPVPVENSDFTLDVSFVIPAIGQRTDSGCLETSTGIEVNRWANIETNEITFETSRKGVFAGGDAQTGASIAINAVAAGKEAATSMLRYLNDEDLALGREKVAFAQKDFNKIPDNIISTSRQTMERLPLDQRLQGFDEVEKGFTEEQALTEAGRCLDCMVCCECLECVKACGAGALTFESHGQQPVQKTLDVGAVVLSPGFEPYDPSGLDYYGYDRSANVVTAMQFERLLSASGPTQGHLVRPSDHQEPKKIAWLQCVGSRDTNRCDNPYCSSVCCMYAIKEAVIAREHAGPELSCTIFNMDIRTHGKEFERYYDQAKNQGVRFLKTRIHSVDTLPDSDALSLRYVTDQGTAISEEFDIVVLSVGLETAPEVVNLAQRLDIALTPGNFSKTGSFTPVATSRPGIFVCGAFQGPRDIPQSVVDSSAAAAAAGALLAPARNTKTLSPEEIPQTNVIGEPPRIGVFVCNCGSNIAGVVDVKAVRDYAADLPFVVYCTDNLYTCSQDTQDNMVEMIREHNLNRIVVAACTPKTHEPLFQETLISAGLNKYLFEMTNIRNQNSWVHKNNPELATEKAKDLIRMSVTRVALMEPLEEAELTVHQTAMVVGGGICGMTAARNLADQGYEVHLVEKAPVLGGQANHLFRTALDEPVAPALAQMIETITADEKIHVHMETELEAVSGFVGNFTSTLANSGQTEELQHGVAILATGARESRPAEYLYGEDDRIVTGLELDKKFKEDDPALETMNAAVFIQCVGSREKERPYCSRVCCTHSIDSALELKRRNPDMAVYVLYRDIRTYGEREYLYQEARKQGVIFIRYTLDNKPVVGLDNGDITVTVTDHILNMPLEIRPDLVTLASAIVPNRDETLANFFKVPLNEDGFFVEKHAKLGPSEFATDGVFLCGMAHYPKPIDEAVAHGQAAASRAVTLLARETVHTSGTVAHVNPMKCSSCGVCVSICPYSAPSFATEGRFSGMAEVNPVLCKGCGLCVASCRSGALHLKGFDNNQIFAQIFSLDEAV